MRTRLASAVTSFGHTTERQADDVHEYARRMAEAERIGRFGVWSWELSTGRVRWSDELHHIYGLQPGEFSGTAEDFLAHVHPDDRERVWADIERAVRQLDAFVFEERIIRADGRERVLLAQGHVVAGPDGAATAAVGVCHDVTERAEAQRTLGLSERRMRAIIDNTPSIVAVKDLQGRYLMTNAECGRIAGASPDELVGRRCVEVFPDIAEQMCANDRTAAAEREAVYDETVLLRDGEPRTYATVTFVLPDDSGLPAEMCTIGTDVTERKERDSERRERLACKQRIDSALSEDRLLAFAQPVIEIATGLREGCELLVRMRSAEDDGAVLQPAAFLPQAERFGLIADIDVWMVGQALRVAPVMAPEVNLSAVTLCDAAARSEIVALLRAAPDAARSIVFEITETAAAEHLAAAREFAADLTALGCGLALDDFGTGFGSFTYLRMLPLRYLKIDRSFVRELVRSRDDRRVVRSIVGIAAHFGLRTIAEGVEDAATLELLGDLGADYAQGFHIGRPASLLV
jgi:PAS domain S-box-containing protein